MTTMLAAVRAYNPDLIYSTGFQLSVAAVFGILLLKKPLLALLEATVFRPFSKPPEIVSNLISISLAAQIATAPIIAATFGEVPVVGVFTSLVAVPLSGPILTLGLLASLAGNVTPALAYPLNSSNVFLVTIVEWVAQGVSALPFAVIETPGIPLTLIGFSTSVVFPQLSPKAYSPRNAGLSGPALVLWTALWLTFAAAVSG